MLSRILLRAVRPAWRLDTTVHSSRSLANCGEAKWVIVTAFSDPLPASGRAGRCVPGPAEEPQPGTQTAGAPGGP
ncbi:hypothetical protein GCM10009677_29010 [Sphaerisporangium rubeum]|uniref:Uncharacterized protein n=1 Tax=Sphaerisporangium rubeum TaxID=321317 RepID=A0A7X0ID04_9ACTN|nr:hypothetical protein [Sphaerisporangium rubeum]